MVERVELAAQAARHLLGTIEGARSFREGWPPLVARRPATSRPLPVLVWLDAARALAVPATRPLVDLICAQADLITWGQSYDAADFGPDFLDRYGWSELIGLRGPIPSETIACGVLMLGPETDYPAHAHAAEELYVPLAGTALWMRDLESPAPRPPGLPIFHPSWMPHAMYTRAEPLLALYVWRGGDLSAKSRIVNKPESTGLEES